MICALKVKSNGHLHKIVIDPWLGMSMTYDDYLKYVASHPNPPYTFSHTQVSRNETVTSLVNQPDFLSKPANSSKNISIKPSTRHVLRYLRDLPSNLNAHEAGQKLRRRIGDCLIYCQYG